ncbi:LytR/AlgR family response regulator transcription factor [Sediminitomix flava]|uniref:LytTR family two component transcriptional regulator n=1 Tax=Sediminitomix flava TaxID=379075 RepID=A0A315ZHT9_SEDFL|nr:LytTR family DNA-binding domain-containing protein [Sediminitomix flava]PWJ45076.1 LytTR family two component transcriptional regulator [Sediminitomix flava]
MKEVFNVVVVEDELPSQRLLVNLIKRVRPNWVILEKFTGVKDTTEWLQDNIDNVDLLFLDIQLSDGLSFEIVEKIDQPVPVIFTTAYDEYAIQAFEVYSMGYLLKPINPQDLESVIKKVEFGFSKAEEYFGGGATEEVDYKELVESIQKKEIKYRDRFLVNYGSGFLKLNVEDIALFHSINKTTLAVTYDKKEYVVDLTLERLEEQLNPDKYFRVNRQMIMNIDAIQSIEQYFNGKLLVKPTMSFNEEIMVSREKARLFKNWINQ